MSRESRSRAERARIALLEEMERETRHIPDAPPSDDTIEDLPFGDPRTLTPEAQRGGR